MNKFGPVAELLCFIEYINIVYGGVSSFPEIIWLSQQTSKNEVVESSTSDFGRINWRFRCFQRL